MAQGGERRSSLHTKCHSEVRPVLARRQMLKFKYTHGSIYYVRLAVPADVLPGFKSVWLFSLTSAINKAFSSRTQEIVSH